MCRALEPFAGNSDVVISTIDFYSTRQHMAIVFHGVTRDCVCRPASFLTTAIAIARITENAISVIVGSHRVMSNVEISQFWIGVSPAYLQ